MRKNNKKMKREEKFEREIKEKFLSLGLGLGLGLGPGLRLGLGFGLAHGPVSADIAPLPITKDWEIDIQSHSVLAHRWVYEVENRVCVFQAREKEETNETEKKNEGSGIWGWR
uniref:Uncharacterized protein n=1 Tax=Tanacetum cinerariifolium TaxID=118510 RepID=A0A6L2M1M8_TANCI|nr:hypothetical protein [Tanacetum cinerariifolium]